MGVQAHHKIKQGAGRVLGTRTDQQELATVETATPSKMKRAGILHGQRRAGKKMF